MPEYEVTRAEQFLEQADGMRDQVDRLTRTVMTREFAEALERVQQARLESTRSPEDAIKLASPDALREQGVELPEGLRVSTRYFENPSAPVQGMFTAGNVRPIGEMPTGITVCASVGTPGVPLCVSVGGEV